MLSPFELPWYLPGWGGLFGATRAGKTVAACCELCAAVRGCDAAREQDDLVHRCRLPLVEAGVPPARMGIAVHATLACGTSV